MASLCASDHYLVAPALSGPLTYGSNIPPRGKCIGGARIVPGAVDVANKEPLRAGGDHREISLEDVGAIGQHDVSDSAGRQDVDGDGLGWPLGVLASTNRIAGSATTVTTLRIQIQLVGQPHCERAEAEAVAWAWRSP